MPIFSKPSNFLGLLKLSHSPHVAICEWVGQWRSGVPDSHLKAGPKKIFGLYSKAKMLRFYPFKGFIYQEKMRKTQNVGLRGPN